MSSPDDLTLTLQPSGFEILTIRGVATVEQVMRLRELRNECRDFMTGRTSEISEDEQLEWWDRVKDSDRWMIWLAYVPGWQEAIGFTLLYKPVLRWYVTLGLRERMRGNGYGHLLYRAMRMQVPTNEVYALIRTDNVASIKAAEKAGYAWTDWHGTGQVRMVGRKLT